MLWENEFYEEGVSIAGRIRELVPKVEARQGRRARRRGSHQHEAASCPAPARSRDGAPRHAPRLVAETLVSVVQRADELAEFVAIYWADGRAPLSAQVKKGLAAAFTCFDEYALAKYDRAGAVRLRDVLFLCHAKPVDAAQAAL